MISEEVRQGRDASNVKLHTTDTVSYTHLDVYKRQDIKWVKCMNNSM